jgi:hypothetical protein
MPMPMMGEPSLQPKPEPEPQSDPAALLEQAIALLPDVNSPTQLQEVLDLLKRALAALGGEEAPESAPPAKGGDMAPNAPWGKRY